MVQRILLTVAYDGRPFSGWALQPDQRTVAGELLGALRQLDPSIVDLRGASRTDAGVHAHGQVAIFSTERDIPSKGWVLGLAQHLPAEISVRKAARVVDEAILPESVRRKRYRYLVLADPVRDPFWEGRALRLTDAVAWDAVAREAGDAVGTHDFAAFRTSADRRPTTVRTIERIAVDFLEGDRRVATIDVTGTAFLHNMVRILVGTLLDVGRARLAKGAVARALASHRRDDLGFTAPPDGLYLEEVVHTLALADPWPEASPT